MPKKNRSLDKQIWANYLFGFFKAIGVLLNLLSLPCFHKVIKLYFGPAGNIWPPCDLCGESFTTKFCTVWRTFLLFFLSFCCMLLCVFLSYSDIDMLNNLVLSLFFVLFCFVHIWSAQIGRIIPILVHISIPFSLTFLPSVFVSNSLVAPFKKSKRMREVNNL